MVMLCSFAGRARLYEVFNSDTRWTVKSGRRSSGHIDPGFIAFVPPVFAWTTPHRIASNKPYGNTF
ncbi:hypothetical protein KEM54_002782, partial [Ascosphaera aggregata]